MGKSAQALNFVRLHLAGVADENRKALERSLKSITAQMAVKGLLNSGPTIRARLEAIRESSAQFIKDAVDGVPEKYRAPETFELIHDAVQQQLEFLATGLPRLVFHGPDTAAGREAVRIFSANRRGLERQLMLVGDAFGVAVDGEPQAGHQRFTDAELRTWIKAQPRQPADTAFKELKAHPRYDGTKQDAFRKAWKMERGTGKGRPRGKS